MEAVNFDVRVRTWDRIRALSFFYGSAVVLGVLVSRKVLFAPGIVGLVHDWAVPPAAAQNVDLARQIFNGWYTWGLGMPAVYPTEYPLKFALGLAGIVGADGGILSKLIVWGVPALAFVSAFYLASKLGITSWPAGVAGAFYALNPVMLNKLVSGQSSYLLGYAVMPAVLGHFLNVKERKQWLRLGFEIGALLSLSAVQIQLGIFAYALLLAETFCYVDAPIGRRLRVLGVATLCFCLIELPAAIGAISGVSSVVNLQLFQENTGWLLANSVPFSEAIRLSGYLTHYDVMSVRGFVSEWTWAGFLVVAAAVAGYASAPVWLRVLAGIAAVPTIVFVCGVYSPAAAPLMWLFSHVRFMEAFRELYHAMAVLAIVYAIGIGFFLRKVVKSWPHFLVRAVALIALGVYVAPMLSGNVAGWLRAFDYGKDLDTAYDVVSSTAERTAWFPMDQPLAYDGAGAGVDPMYVTKYGSLWLYSLAWPLSAIDMAARSHRWSELQSTFQQLGVASAVERRLFTSRLARFIPPNTNAMSFYLQSPLPALQLPKSTDENVSESTRVDFVSGPLPMAYSVARAAIAPTRIDTLPMVPLDAVPIPYGTVLPPNVPYVVVNRRGNEADEAMTAFPEIQLGNASLPNRGFVPIDAWWWYRPAYADADHGWLTMGRHRAEIPVAASMPDAVLEVSFQATPVGGRISFSYDNRSWVIDTNGSSETVFSKALDVGSVTAGSHIAVQTEDLYDDVAVLSCRLVQKPQFLAAVNAFDGMLRNARRIITFAAQTPSFGPSTPGRGAKLGELDPERTYLLRIRYSAPHRGYVEVADPSQYAIARKRVLPTRQGTIRLTFDGAPGDFAVRMRAAGARVLSWSISSAARMHATPQDPKKMDVLKGTWHIDGGATFERHLPLLVVNDAYNIALRPRVPIIAHLRSIFGTNVYVTNDDRPTRIADAHATLERLAYGVGVFLIAAALVSLALRPKSNLGPRV